MTNRPFSIQLDGEEKELTPDNCGIAMFRQSPDNNYLDVWEAPEQEGEGERHWWVFNQREFLLWMGGVALDGDDLKIIRLAERTNGTFADRHGWQPQVIVEDRPAPYEEELFVRYATGGMDDEWQHLLDEGEGEDYSRFE